jgi:hypothetical protein
MSSLTLTTTHSQYDIAIEEWRASWRECGATIHSSGLSPTIEALHIKDNVLAIGAGRASSIDALTWFSHCSNIKVVEYSSRSSDGDTNENRATYLLPSDIRLITNMWPSMAHFASDAVFAHGLSRGEDSQMTMVDLPLIIRCLPVEVDSIRMILLLPIDWNAVVFGAED